MAMQILPSPLSRCINSIGFAAPLIPLRALFLVSALYFCSISAYAQFQLPLVFSSGGGVVVRNDQTGALTAVSGSPFPATRQQLAIDVQGRFLFGLGVNSIHMFQITDPATGAYKEVPRSPFASPDTNQPLFVAVEPAGKYIAVVNGVGRNPGEASVETFRIDAANLALVPVTGSFTELDSTPVFPGGTAQPPNHQKFYVYMGPNLSSRNTIIQNGEELAVISIDPLSGFLQGIQNNPDTSTGRCFAMDPQGRYIVKGHGQFGGLIDFIGIDGTFPGATISLGTSDFPKALFVDSTGTFLYATHSIGQTPATVVHIYSLNLRTGAVSEIPSSPLPHFTNVPNFAPDPTGPFEYAPGPQTNQVQGFTVDPLTGYFLEIPGSPFTIPGLDSFFFTIPSGQQPISGPSVSLSATGLSLGTIQIGSTSAAQTLSVTSTGGQALSLNSISISGANASEFSETDTCQVPTALPPGKFCSISVTFTPSAAGPQQATLIITDNAPGSPQLIPLSGAGVAPPPPAPAVALSPNPVTFTATPQGTASSPITITLTNSGTATLHLSSVILGGNNPGDFSMNNSCSGALAARSACTITATFTPTALGQRSATLTITDDAPDSPQMLALSGTASAPPSTKPAVALHPVALSFAATTQGTASGALSLTLTNSGTGTLHISSVVLGGANPDEYSMTSGCTAAAYAASATCTIGMVFAPAATGMRTATITIADDAADSPQVVNLSGNANPAFSVAPATGSSTTASVTAGQTAQYQMQLTPGPGYTGSISLACSGAPFGAACHVPTSVSIPNGAPAQFTVTVTTSGAALLPHSPARRITPIILIRVYALLALLFVFLIFFKNRGMFRSIIRTQRLAWSFALVVPASCVVFSLGGCGGGSMTAAPSVIVTPSGTSTITITPAAMSATGKPLQLPLIQLTLTVK